MDYAQLNIMFKSPLLERTAGKFRTLIGSYH